MLAEVCEIAKQEMKEKCEDELGSWHAVTTADGTWQTRGWHSKNATFTIRNYLNGVRAKQKSFTNAFMARYEKQYPKVHTLTCHCRGKHKAGCGCLSVSFIGKAHTVSPLS